MHWYTDVIRRYTDFDGRADRPEFRWFALINLIISPVIWAVGIALFGYAVGELLAIVYGLATLLPVLGVEIRRLHDTNKSGWWIVVSLVPFVGVPAPRPGRSRWLRASLGAPGGGRSPVDARSGRRRRA